MTPESPITVGKHAIRRFQTRVAPLAWGEAAAWLASAATAAVADQAGHVHARYENQPVVVALRGRRVYTVWRADSQHDRSSPQNQCSPGASTRIRPMP